MACACQGGKAAAAASSEFVINFADGSTSNAKYASEADAKVALARTGKSGTVRAVSK